MESSEKGNDVWTSKLDDADARDKTEYSRRTRPGAIDADDVHVLRSVRRKAKDGPRTTVTSPASSACMSEPEMPGDCGDSDTRVRYPPSASKALAIFAATAATAGAKPRSSTRRPRDPSSLGELARMVAVVGPVDGVKRVEHVGSRGVSRVTTNGGDLA